MVGGFGDSGFRCALVGTGGPSVESLTGLGADVVLAGLDQPDDLLELWLRPARR
jgi:hypothetical protein